MSVEQAVALCYYHYALRRRDSETCSQIPSQPLAERCKYDVLLESGRFTRSDCERIDEQDPHHALCVGRL